MNYQEIIGELLEAVGIDTSKTNVLLDSVNVELIAGRLVLALKVFPHAEQCEKLGIAWKMGRM